MRGIMQGYGEDKSFKIRFHLNNTRNEYVSPLKKEHNYL